MSSKIRDLHNTGHQATIHGLIIEFKFKRQLAERADRRRRPESRDAEDGTESHYGGFQSFPGTGTGHCRKTILLSIIIPTQLRRSNRSQRCDQRTGVDWPRPEVVVVDDGSTDSSRDVIRNTAIGSNMFRRKRKRKTAAPVWVHAGFPLTSGEPVYVLDSDDLGDSGGNGRRRYRCSRPDVQDPVLPRVIAAKARKRQRHSEFTDDLSHDKVIHGS